MSVQSKIALPFPVQSDGSHPRGLDIHSAWSSHLPNLDNTRSSLGFARSDIGGSGTRHTSASVSNTPAPDSLVDVIQLEVTRLHGENVTFQTKNIELQGRVDDLECVPLPNLQSTRNS